MLHTLLAQQGTEAAFLRQGKVFQLFHRVTGGSSMEVLKTSSAFLKNHKLLREDNTTTAAIQKPYLQGEYGRHAHLQMKHGCTRRQQLIGC